MGATGTEVVYATNVIVRTIVRPMKTNERELVGTISTRGCKVGSSRRASEEVKSNRSRMLRDIDWVAASDDAQTITASTEARITKA